MELPDVGDKMNRSVKLAMDSGEVATLAEALKKFSGYQLVIEVGPKVATSPTFQAALLTAINTGRRCFLGGVFVTGNLDVPLLLTWRRCRTLKEAVIDLKGKPGQPGKNFAKLPRIVMGDANQQLLNREINISSSDRSRVNTAQFAVRITFNGWSGGIVPVADNRRLLEQQEFTPAGVLAGALAVCEAFQFVRGGNALAGRRDVGLSLWRPEANISWLDETTEPGPSLDFLPAKLWLIGLGHLGQAYLWTLGFLPYACPEEVLLLLQDFDTLVDANDSTSLLTNEKLIGQKKTRAMALWCEERGFKAVINERRFEANFQIANDEPQLALCGVDNRVARSVLEKVGFKRVIEAGLGKGVQEYLAFQIHTLPARKPAEELWGDNYNENGGSSEVLVNLPAYQDLAASNQLDECGLTSLAGRSVGASFVGAITATLVIAEVLRMMHKGYQYQVIDGTLSSLERRQAVRNDIAKNDFNPGFTKPSPIIPVVGSYE